MRKVRLLPNALQPNDKYPFGYFKGSSTPEAKNGTPILADSANDWYGANSALLVEAGMEANGEGEGVGHSQVVAAIKKLIQNSATSLNNSLQAMINKLRSDAVQGDKDTLSNANEHTDTSVQTQDGKAKQYAANARMSAISSVTETLKSYVTNTALNTKLNSYVTNTTLTTKLASYVTNTTLNTKLKNYCALDTSSNADKVDYPIGTTLLCNNISGFTQSVTRNSKVSVYLASNHGNHFDYRTYPEGAKIEGSWRVRGCVATSGCVLVQRVS